MTFTIDNEEFTFTLQVDEYGKLTSFTATKDQVTYDCSIQLASRANQERMCCTQWGCSPGSC